MKPGGIFIQIKAGCFCSAAFLPLSLAFAVAALAVAGCATPHTTADLPLKVVLLKGQACWKTGTNEWQRVGKGQSIRPGSVIETAQTSRVDLVIYPRSTCHNSSSAASAVNRTRISQGEPAPARSGAAASRHSQKPKPILISLWENTRVAVSQLKCPETNQTGFQTNYVALDLQAGHMFLAVAEPPAGAALGITLPEGSASVANCAYCDIGASGVIKVLEGSIAVTVSNISQSVSSGQRFDARTGALTALPDSDRQSMVILLQYAAPL
jgi:hypothetical protein